MNLFRQFLFWILLALAGALLAQLLLQDPGFVLVRYRNTTVEATLVGALVLLAAAVIALWLLWSLVNWPFRLWRTRRERTARARLGEGLDALHLGRYAQAEALLTQAARDKQFEAPARVAAARAALARGDVAAAATHLDALPDKHAASRAIVLAETALTDGRTADACAALDALTGPAPPRAIALRAEALSASGQHAEAYGMLGALRAQQALPSSALADREQLWAEYALREAADGNALADRWDTLSGTLRTTPAVARVYAERAAALHWNDAAATVLETAVDAQWDDTLAADYGRLPVDRLDAAALERRSTQAVRWLEKHPDSVGALLGAARLALAQGRWLQAEPHLHRAIAQGGGSDAWEALGHGFLQAGDSASAMRCYANALRAARGDAISPLHDDGHDHDSPDPNLDPDPGRQPHDAVTGDQGDRRIPGPQD